MTPQDCPGADTECVMRTCEMGQCGVLNLPPDTPVGPQVPGDCKRNVCDGQGNVTSQEDTSDIKDDQNACTDDSCSAGAPVSAPVQAGAPCNAGGGKVCDGNGACVECLSAADCASQVCVAFSCAAPTCGDGVINGSDQCDDGNASNNDACVAGCVIATCGDGFKFTGVEACDDGNVEGGDGCGALCDLATGESCADPLAPAQAQLVNGALTWVIPSGGVTDIDGEFACDASGSGPDAVLVYTKTSEDLANGGKLLHVRADTGQTATAYYLNVEIVSGACDPAQGTRQTCLWFKHDWDSYLDVPPGKYFIWVAKNSPATGTMLFPETVVTVREIDAAGAEGEGCFAPYTADSSNYTPSAGMGSPHVWTLPASINSFDMGPTWGEPGSVSCDNTEGYGDIHGVDAVIEYTKESAASVLKIDVQNLDPTLNQSDLNVELLSVCSPVSPLKASRNCRANADALSFTAPAPVGPSYIWVSSEATAEEFNGATVSVTEIFPGLGESWGTAEPLAGSGLITPTSAMRLDAPSCFPASGNVHWYSYTVTNSGFRVAGSAAGALGVIDASGQPIGCVTDAQASPIGRVVKPGETVYIAVQSPSAIGALTIHDVPYAGLLGEVTDLDISFPSSATADYGMAVSATEILLGSTTKVFTMPKGGGTLAKEFGAAQGLTATHLGYDIELAGGSIFSVDSTATSNVSRLFRVFDGSAWGPAAWDLTPSYPANAPSHALAFDGTSVLMATRQTTTKVDFYAFSTLASGAPVHLGANTGVYYVVGLAADSQYFYVAGAAAGGEGVFRIERANVAAPATKLASIDMGTLKNNIDIDDPVSPDHLYVRAANGDLHVVQSPAEASFFHLGVVSSLGTANDVAMAYDTLTDRLYLYETETKTEGRILEMQ